MDAAHVVWFLASLANLLIMWLIIRNGAHREPWLFLVQGVSFALAANQNYIHFARVDHSDAYWIGMDMAGIFVSLAMARILSRVYRPDACVLLGVGYFTLSVVKIVEYALTDSMSADTANVIYQYRRWFALILSYSFIFLLYHRRMGTAHEETLCSKITL